jgi:hypothetical protein
MDNMPMGWHRPQEDEFGICNQGVPSPYLFWMFPDRPCPYDRYLALSGLSTQERRHWKRAFFLFIKRLKLRDPRRLVLKSPTHTARVKTLLEIFPDAQFIHLVRDPQVMIPSTILTWRRLSEVLGLRAEIRDDLADYVLDNFRRMDESFQADRWRIPAEQFYEARYEDLTANMVATVADMYRHLSLGDFSNIRPHLEEYELQNKDYRANRFSLDADLRHRIDVVCRDYSERYGYAEQKLQATS